MHGDAALFDALVARGRRKRRIRTSTIAISTRSASFRDPALIDRGLQPSLSPQLRSQDTAIYPRHASSSIPTRATAP